MTKTRCVKCKGTDLLQKASILLDPNEPQTEWGMISLNDMEWEDFTYCRDCEDGVQTEEFEEDDLTS
jgi:hypothetical protein